MTIENRIQCMLIISCVPVSIAVAGDLYPTVDPTADWKYSDNTYDSGDFRQITASTPEQPFGFENESAFNIDWIPGPDSFPIAYDMSFGQSDRPYLTQEPSTNLGNYAVFGSLATNPYSGNPDSKFIMRYTGSFSEEHA